jgi:integrase
MEIGAATKSHGRVLKFALEFLGDKRLAEISARDLRRLEQALTEIPGRKNIPGEHRKSLYSRYLYGQLVGVDTLTRISSTTVENTYFGTMNSFLEWAKAKTDWKVPGFTFNAKCAALAEPQPRDAFRDDELLRFFALPLFTGCVSPAHIWQPGKCFVQNGLYWGYILHIFMGLRPSEIGKLRTTDIVRDGEFQFIDMRREKVKTKEAKEEKSRELKTDNAYRRVPIPSLVTDLGLIDLKIALEARGETRLFPDWHVYRHPGSGREMWGHYLSKSWQYVRGAHEFERDFLTLYSGRHTLAGWYDAMKLPQRIRNRLFGHAAQDVPGNYGPIDLTLDEARAALSTELAIQFDIANILLTAKLKAEYGELTPGHQGAQESHPFDAQIFRQQIEAARDTQRNSGRHHGAFGRHPERGNLLRRDRAHQNAAEHYEDSDRDCRSKASANPPVALGGGKTAAAVLAEAEGYGGSRECGRQEGEKSEGSIRPLVTHFDHPK